MAFFRNYFSGYYKQGGMKELLIIALPMIISTACDGVMTFTDRLFLSRLGYEQMNAAMGGGIAAQMLMFFFVGLTGYTTALVAQYFGAKEFKNVSKSLFQGIIICCFSWPVILVLKPLVVVFFTQIGTPESQLGFQIDYLNILVWGSVLSLLRHTIGCYFIGIGKTKIVMNAAIAAMIANVFLDYLLIFGKFGIPAMGIQGAAIASISGSFVGTLVLLITYFKQKQSSLKMTFASFRFEKLIMKKLIHFGYPAGLELFLNFLAFSAMVALFHAQGDEVATAATIMFNWDLVSFLPLLGIEIAVTSIVGRYMGAQKSHVAERATYSAIKIGIFYSIFIFFLFTLIPETLVRVFSPEEFSQVFENMIPLAVNMIRLATLYVLADATMVSLIGALRGAGDTFYTMLISVISHWILVLMIFLSFYVFDFTPLTAWFLVVISFLGFSLVLYIRFKSGKWKKIKVIDSGINV